MVFRKISLFINSFEPFYFKLIKPIPISGNSFSEPSSQPMYESSNQSPVPPKKLSLVSTPGKRSYARNYNLFTTLLKNFKTCVF